MRIRSHFLLLASVVLLPGLLAAAIAIEKVRDGERRAGLNALQETVRATALLVDGQVGRSIGALTVLAQSPHLQSGDLIAFYAEAKAADVAPDVWTLLLDEDGHQKLNTSLPFGTPIPPPFAREHVATVLKTQTMLVTDVVAGPATGKLLTTLYLPAKPSVHGRFVVAQAFSVDHWRKTALRPKGRTDWIVAVIDRQGKFIARSHRAETFLGRDARPELVTAAATAHDGLIRHSTLEGIESYDAFTHSDLTGWTIAVAAPVGAIEASATQSVAWLVGGLAAALLVTALGASLLSRRVIGAIDTALAGARALGRGQQPAPARTSLHEVNTLNVALAEAGRRLDDERGARAVVETERERLLENERAARETAQRENAAKDRFMALLGHELRNPLAAISGASEVLARTQRLEPSAERFLAIIQRQNLHLSRIVDDLLEISRMLSGKIVLDGRPINLGDCVRASVESLRTHASAREARIRVRIEDVWILGDSVRIEQIVNNLVTNSLKYSAADGSISVTVAATPTHALLDVADLGAGITADLLPHVFEPFVQGPPPGGIGGGLGIGLALVKQLVELHGGSVRAESAGAGAGARFSVQFPRLLTVMQDGEGRSIPQRTGFGRVLLVEDNDDTRETTATLLRHLGYDVAEARDADDALWQASAQTPRVVILDLGLPRRDGYALAEALRALPGFGATPMIAVSGFGQERDKAATRAAGFSAHLTKPADPDTLDATIRRLLRNPADDGPVPPAPGRPAVASGPYRAG